MSLLQVQKHLSTYKVFPLVIIIQEIRTVLQQGIRQLFQSSILTQLLSISGLGGTVCIKLSIFVLCPITDHAWRCTGFLINRGLITHDNKNNVNVNKNNNNSNGNNDNNNNNNIKISELQKIALLGTSRILRKTLSIKTSTSF